MSRATEIADAITQNWIGTPPAWAVEAQNELRRLDAENAELRQLVTKVHTAKGRYHTQIAMCDLFDAVGIPNERPKK